MKRIIKALEDYYVRHAMAFNIPLRATLVLVAILVRLKGYIYKPRGVLYVGHAYYNCWYLSRELRLLGWRADVLNWDTNSGNQIYYHGEDYLFKAESGYLMQLLFYFRALFTYEIFHFSNMHGITFGDALHSFFEKHLGEYSEIYFLKKLGKIIIYSHSGCLDGVSQTAFSQWGPESVCSICRWRNEASVCSDERNLAWGEFRNRVADYQCLLGGNRVDYNTDLHIHEVPEFYCLDKAVWHPDISVPAKYQFLDAGPDVVRLYHAVGHKAERTTDDGVNIKSSHVYLPLIQRLKDEGLALQLIEPSNIPNKEVRFLQVQADIFLDMLTYGWFGANAREAMMLGKPVICYIRPEWLESLRKEIPEYADELPVISATPLTIEKVLRELIANPKKCKEIGARGREFALKWHSSEAGARRFDEIYGRLLQGDYQLRSY